MSELTAIPVAESAGVKSRFGAVESAATTSIKGYSASSITFTAADSTAPTVAFSKQMVGGY